MGSYEKVTQVGLDVHRKFSMASLRDASGKVVARERLEHDDLTKLDRRVGCWPAGTPVILEATFGWGWMSDRLAAARMDPHLASSRKTAAWREGRGLAKSNKIDANLLAELWDEKPILRHGLPQRWWEVWLAPQEVRDQRELLRHRMALVKMQTALKNRIHATLHRHGILCQESDLFGVSGRRFLSLLLNDAQALRETARLTLKEDLILLDQLRRLIARATRQFRRQLQRSEEGQRLMTLPGVSTVLAYTILAEIGRIERFAKPKCLVRYSLLAPLADDSGDERAGKPIGRHLGHDGRKTLQWAWIEAAHGAVRKDAGLRGIFNRRTNNGKEDRNRGYIKVAHQMCCIGHAMWRNKSDYQEVSPSRPGSKQKMSLSRSGTGQPFHPMATGPRKAVPERPHL
ncbi:MAG TPA: IS110 family transposase [Humisphaera sp.]|jgi:transposase|nr:IS110 family transposase [Humisphaera sp.]